MMPTIANSRHSFARSRAFAIRTPTAAPANANPIQGNAVNVVLSAAGRTYHCIQTGSTETNAVVLTSGVVIATAVAQAEYATTSAGVDSKHIHSRPHPTIAGPMMLRISTRNNVIG